MPAIGWGDKDSWVLLAKTASMVPTSTRLCMANWDKGTVVRKIAERLEQSMGYGALNRLCLVSNAFYKVNIIFD